MSDVFQTFNAYCEPGITEGAPTVSVAIAAGNWTVDKVTIVIPAGHAGLTGIQLWYGGGPAIPYESGWFSGDDDVIPIQPSNIFPAGVPWSVAMLNNDVIQHGWQTRWELSYLPAGAATSTPAVVTAADIYSAANLTTVGA